jgi:hypothetical protein
MIDLCSLLTHFQPGLPVLHSDHILRQFLFGTCLCFLTATSSTPIYN